MDPVVVEREADHQGVHAEHGLEVADDRDRAAGADRYRLLAPFLGERGARLAQSRIIERHLERRIAAEIAEFDRTIGWHAGADKIAEGIAYLFRVLGADQTERDLGAGFAGDHGLGPLPGIAADDAVDLGRRPRRDLLEQDAAL